MSKASATEATAIRKSYRTAATPVNYSQSPRNNPLSTTSKKSSSSNQVTLNNEWQWLCGSCISIQGNEIIGSEVKVWWHDDECAYEGIVNAFDVDSGCHRVLYEDKEWEFVQFAQEVFLLKPPAV